jgi:excisionase family DNA binding protein
VALEATTNCWAVADVLRPCVARVVVSKAARTVGYFYFDPNLGNLGAVRFQGVSRHRGISMVKLDEFVTIKQAAKLLGVSANTLRNWHRDAKIPVYRNPVSGYRLFKKADLDELLRKIEESGKYPSGWSRPQQSPRHPR